MANHVYFTITIDGMGENEWEHLFKEEEITYKDYQDEEQTRMDLVELHDQPFYEGVGEKVIGENGWLENGYDWYCDNVGAKWCNIEDWSSGYIYGYSAWSQPTYLAENIVKYLSEKYDREFSAKMTFEDEFRNFIGIEHFDSCKLDDEWAVATDENIIDGNDINIQVEENYKCDVSDDDFDWWEEREDINGETTVPSEYADDLVYNFFETGQV